MSTTFKGRRTDWLTPLSHTQNVAFRGLIDNGRAITVNFLMDGTHAVSFVWETACAYRNTLEEHRLPWDLNSAPGATGCTNIVQDSRWIAELRENNDIFELTQSGAQHYVIGSDIYCTEVIAQNEPRILITEDYEN